MEAGTLTNAGRLGLLGRRSRLLKLHGDERLIALIRAGQERAFEALVERYQVRLFAFCRGMLGSAEDAEDVLQEVFVAAHKAILADNRAINARPWLYRIARNRCLNHMRKPVPDGQDSMDVLPHENGRTVAERVEEREEFRALIGDVGELPETQRTALLLREIDAMAYEEIAVAMETTVPAVKSLLVRARMSLADASQGRLLTCDEVHLELAEAAEGLRKTSGPARAHIKSCDRCRAYRNELQRSRKALAAIVPIGPLAAVGHGLAAKLGLGGAQAGAAAAGGGSGALGVAGGGAAAAIGSKAAAGVASVAILTAGAYEVNHLVADSPAAGTPAIEQTIAEPPTSALPALPEPRAAAPKPASEPGPRASAAESGSSEKSAEPQAPAESATAATAETSSTASEPTAAGGGSGQDDASGGGPPGAAVDPNTGAGTAAPSPGTGGTGVPAEPPPSGSPPPAPTSPGPQVTPAGTEPPSAVDPPLPAPTPGPPLP